MKILKSPEYKNFRQKAVGLFFCTVSFGVLLPFQNCSQIMGFEAVTQNMSMSSFASSLSQSLGKTPIRRLSNLEYTNSLADVVDYQFKKQNSASILGPVCLKDANVTGALSALPADTSSVRMASDQIASYLSPSRFEAYVQIANSIASCLTKDLSTLKAFAGACVTSANSINDSACVDNFIQSFGQFAFRKSVLPIELNELKASSNSWNDLIGRVLVHPRFLSHIEREGTQVQTGVYKLTAYELEARLTSVFWKSVPDSIGLEAAASGRILTPEGLSAEVDRILSSSKAQDTMWIFYQQWFGASRLQKNFALGKPMEAFANPFSVTELNTMPTAVLEEAKQFFNYFTWQTNGTLEQIFRSPLIFSQNATLAKIYGVTPRTSAADSPRSDITGRYHGILTRAFVTQQKISSNGEANHIQRGVLFATNFLALELGLPANFAEQSATANSVPATASTRQEATIKTSLSSCMACHSIINPSGFAFAHYDSIGRYSDTEIRYVDNADYTGVIAKATNSIDSTTVLNISGIKYNVSDIPSLVDAMVSSGKLFEAFSKYYFRFAFGRLEDVNSDRETLKLISTQTNLTSIKSTLKLLATSPYFAYAKAP